MTIAREPNYSGVLVDTMQVQVRLKEIIVKGVQRGTPERTIKKQAKKLIDDYCKTIADDAFRERARRTLIASFKKWYREMAVLKSVLPFLLLAKFRNVPPAVEKEARAKVQAVSPDVLRQAESRFNATAGDDYWKNAAEHFGYKELGQEWHDAEYRRKMKQEYSRALVRFADEDATYSPRVSLRNLAEVEVRRRENDDRLAGLRERGVRFVWASSHADCSKRCEPWQGRLYSLDGTSGTEGGFAFLPIETAVNVRDKYGNINGLLGYNCRHRLIEYTDGSHAPIDYSKKQMAEEREVDKRQRSLERTVRKWKMRGYVLRASKDPTERAMSAKAFDKAREWEEIYKDYSKRHNRAYYVERIALMREEMPQKK